MLTYVLIGIIVVLVIILIDTELKYEGLRDTFDELAEEPKRWVDLAIKQGYLFHTCPECGEPMIRGDFDEDTLRICGRCDAVFRVELATRTKKAESSVDVAYKLKFLGYSLDITGIYIKQEQDNAQNKDAQAGGTKQ